MMIVVKQRKGNRQMNEYDQQAEDFLKETNTNFSVEFMRHGKYFPGDKESRDIYDITLQRGEKSYTFSFGQSMVNSEECIEPTPYDVLACLTKYDPGSFSWFCDDFGYSEDSDQAYETYKAVKKEYKELSNLYSSEELDLMGEIQ